MIKYYEGEPVGDVPGLRKVSPKRRESELILLKRMLGTRGNP